MPKAGFKSITVSEVVYNKFHDVYKKNRQELAMKGINSFAGYIKNRIAEVAIQNGELYCMLCEEKDCFHIGFVFSLPDVYEVLNARGIKHQR
ncbi:MAG: hypothetical protein HY295_03790 [Thaumarchaeota archaeon]|nr:hypothetical protein [Nitrososphaerota archaeon]